MFRQFHILMGLEMKNMFGINVLLHSHDKKDKIKRIAFIIIMILLILHISVSMGIKSYVLVII